MVMAELFVPYLCKYSVLEATKLIFVYGNDSSIYLCQKVKMDNYHPGRLFWLISQISVHHNMVGFVVDGHISQRSIYSHYSMTVSAVFPSIRTVSLTLIAPT